MNIKREQAVKIGKRVADWMGLKRDRNYKDRYETAIGSKTELGLGATILRIIQEETGKTFDVQE